MSACMYDLVYVTSHPPPPTNRACNYLLQTSKFSSVDEDQGRVTSQLLFVNVIFCRSFASIDHTSTSQRDEKDLIHLQSGLEHGVTLGTPIAFLVKNEDQRPHDYSETDLYPRPSHADYTYLEKYGIKASSGGGRSSARETVG
jgi:hypothetical protein